MALRFQDIPIPFVAGQTAGADAALIQPPDVIRVTNGEFGDRGNIRAVDGLTGLVITAMTVETAPDDVNPTLRRLMTHKDELLLETYKGIFRQQVGGSFALGMSSSNRKRDEARCMRMGVTSICDAQGTSAPDWDRSERPNAGVLGVDAAQLGDYTCTVWIETWGTGGTPRTQLSWQIRHSTSDAIVGRGRVRDSVGNMAEPRVVAFGGQFRIFALSNGDIGYLFINPSSTQNIAESLTKYTAVGTYQFMDVALGPSDFCISATTTAPAVQSFVFTQAAPTVLVGAPFVAAAGACTPVANFYIAGGGGGVGNAFVAFFACGGSAGTLRWFAASTGGTGLGQGNSALTGVVAIGRPVAFKSYTGAASAYPVLLDLQTVSGLEITAVAYNGTTAAPGAMFSGATSVQVLADHICMGLPLDVGVTYTGTQGQGVLLPVQSVARLSQQNVFQVVDIAYAVSRIIASESSKPASFPVLRVFDAGAVFNSHYNALSGVFSIGRVCSMVTVANGAYAWSAKFTPNISDVNNLGANPTNIQRNKLSYDDKLGFIEFADVTYLAGGCPLVYDGQDLFEEGFTYAPDAASVSVTGGGALEGGTYLICFVYEWFDGQGNRWQSAPSNVIQFVAEKNDKYSAVVRAYAPTLKSGVQVIPYRTAAGDTVYYRDSPLAGAALPLTDTALKSSELLYTGPGSLLFAGTQSNNALPGVKNFTEHQSRLVAVGGEYARGFFYSKERADRFPAEFNRAAGFGQVPDITGRIAAASSVDDKLLLFAENGLSVVFGQGPNQNWLQNGFGAPVRIQAAEGIRFDSPFIAEVPDGVWYVTTAGPRMLTRGLTTAKDAAGGDLGDKLRTQTQVLLGQCAAVFTHPTRAQVWFVTGDQTFIFDYLHNVWSYRTSFSDDVNHPFAGAAAARGVLYALSLNGMSTALRYVDPASVESNPLVLEFGWVGFAGVQRFQRFTHLQVTGTEGTKSTFTPDLNVDLKVWEKLQPTTQVQSVNLDVPMLEQANLPWQCEFQMAYQQGTGYKLRLTFTPNVAKGGNFTVTSILARVGMKSGGARLPNSQRG